MRETEFDLPPFFWLHIKKSAGISTRKLLKPYYKEVNRRKVKSFNGAKPEYFNDIINNYRVDLGKLQLKRCLYAKEILYKEDWARIYSFAFAREPIDRAVSMFYYLYYQDQSKFFKKMTTYYRNLIKLKKLTVSESYSFDAFLDYIKNSRASKSFNSPIDLHFTTHTASLWDDITDQKGNIIISSIYRLENLEHSINNVFEICNLDKRLETKPVVLNRNKSRKSFTPSSEQVGKIKSLFEKDFEIYESAK